MELTRRAFAQGTLALAAGALAGCTANGAAGAGSEGGEDVTQVIVAMSTGSEPAAGFDPLVAWGCGEHVHEPLIQSTLVATDEDLAFVNDLATDYSCSDDGLTWSFTIRDDVLFSDGVPLTAADVAFTVNGVVTSEASQADLSMVDEAVALDDTHVELCLNKPCNALLYTLAVLGIVPEHAYDEGYGSAPIGSGRYLLEQWDVGQQVILSANPDYYGDAPTMQRVVVLFMEEDAALAAARAGQADIVYTASTYSDQAIDGYELFSCESVDSRGVSLPCVASGATKADGEATYDAGNDVTCDLAVRQAMNLAVDRDAMIDDVLNGHGTPAYSVCDGAPWASEDMHVDTDVEGATALLEEAGWALGDDGVRSREGVRASLSLYYPSGDSVRQALAAELSNQMAAIGIEVSAVGTSWDEIYAHEFCDPVLWGWGANSPMELYNLIYSSGNGNFACYDSNAVDEHVDAALGATEVEGSYDEWQLAQWDGEDGVAPQGAATWVWLTNVDHLYFKREGLQVAAQKPHPHGHGWSLVNNVDRWSWG